MTKVKINMNYNCYWDASGEEIDFAGMKLENWRKETRHDPNSIVADPLFMNPQQFDFRLQNDSPILNTPFKPFDYTKAGVYGDPGWIRKAKSAEFPPLEMPPSPPPASTNNATLKDALPPEKLLAWRGPNGIVEE